MRKHLYILFLLLAFSYNADAQQMQLGLLVYNGGGDWYANPTALKNLAQYCNEQLRTSFQTEEAQVEIGSQELYNYPFVHMTGHGRWAMSEQEAENLRNYLISGGFLHIDDNYGMDKYVRPALKQLFPDLELVELPFNHPIYHQKFDFPQGLPKIHEHDKKAPKGYGLIYKGRLVCFYSTETDLGDGWEDPEVHNDTQEHHEKALQMGANIIQYAFTQQDS